VGLDDAAVADLGDNHWAVARSPQRRGAAVTREESRQVEGVTLTILRHITSLGYTVSVFRIPSSLLGTRPGSVEMHALDLSVDLPVKHVGRLVEGEGGDLDYRCTCLLAELVGVELPD
jgi:hypothetical protein